MNTPTQHADAIAVAEIIRAFKARYPDDADRLLTEYAELRPAGLKPAEAVQFEEKIRSLNSEIKEVNAEVGGLDASLEEAQDERDGLREDLRKANERIEDLEGQIEEANFRIQTLEMEAAE